MWPWGFIWGVISLVWAVAIVCICIMKKLQPENAIIYAFWAVGWCVAVTIFAAIVQAGEVS